MRAFVKEDRKVDVRSKSSGEESVVADAAVAFFGRYSKTKEGVFGEVLDAIVDAK